MVPMRYSSKLAAFNEERRSIKLMLLYNGSVFSISFSLLFLFFVQSYFPKYIHRRFIRFFKDHLRITSTISSIEDKNGFVFIRSYLINKSTPVEHEMASRIAEAINTDTTDTLNGSLVTAHVSEE